MENTKTIRFDVDLTENEQNTLDEMRKRSHRSRKNFAEALIKVAVKSFMKGSALINLDDLGVVEKQTLIK